MILRRGDRAATVLSDRCDTKDVVNAKEIKEDGGEKAKTHTTSRHLGRLVIKESGDVSRVLG